DEEVDKPEPVRIPWGFLILIALIAAVGFAARSYYSQHGWAKLRRQATPVQTKLSSTPTVAQPTPAPIAADQSATLPKVDAAQKDPVAPVAEEFVVKVHAKESAWLWIKA